MNSKGKCTGCGKFFPSEELKRHGSMKFHSKDCLLEYASRNVKQLSKQGVKEKEKAERRRLQERKKALRPRAWYLNEAQKWVNKFIRLRDKGLPCISCGRIMNEGGYIGAGGVHAGHYRSRGACPELRYHELNINAQCAQCNNENSGNQIMYRKGLIKKIGVESVEWIEGPHEPKKYTIDDLKQIIEAYKAKCKELQND